MYRHSLPRQLFLHSQGLDWDACGVCALCQAVFVRSSVGYSNIIGMWVAMDLAVEGESEGFLTMRRFVGF